MESESNVPAEREPALSERLTAVKTLAEAHLERHVFDFKESAVREVVRRLAFDDLVKKIQVCEKNGLPIGRALELQAKIFVAAAMAEEIQQYESFDNFDTDSELYHKFKEAKEELYDTVFELTQLRNS